MSWLAVSVVDQLLYSGFWLAPGVMYSKARQGPWSNCQCRTAALAATAAPMSTNACLYNARAAPTLGYAAQLVPLPVKMVSEEVRQLVNICRHAGGNFR